MLLPDVAYFRTQRFELSAYRVAPDACCRQQRQFFRRGLQGLLVLVHLFLQGIELTVRDLQQTVGCGELILCRLEFDFLMQLERGLSGFYDVGKLLAQGVDVGSGRSLSETVLRQ